MKGLKPTPIDARDSKFAAHRVFGVALDFPDNYHRSNGQFPDQNKDRRPTACTAYTIADLVTRNEFVPSRDYQLMKTLLLMNARPDADGADARTAFKVATGIGMLSKEKEPAGISNLSQSVAADPKNWSPDLDIIAAQNRIPAFLPIKPVPDYFDAIRSALFLGENEDRRVGMATQWSPSFEAIHKDGILPNDPLNLYWGHMYEMDGWKTMYGEPYLTLKTWQGTGYGDQGYCYMSRALTNRLMGTWGAFAAAFDFLPPETIDQLKAQKTDLIETAIALAKNLLGQLLYRLSLS